MIERNKDRRMKMTSEEAVNLFKQYHWRVEDKNKALQKLDWSK